MRTYKPRKPKARRGRMLRAVKMRAEGKSLREIARILEVSYQTVANDLASWAAESAKVSSLPVKNSPPGGEKLTAEFDGAEIIPLRRQA